MTIIEKIKRLQSAIRGANYKLNQIEAITRDMLKIKDKKVHDLIYHIWDQATDSLNGFEDLLGDLYDLEDEIETSDIEDWIENK